MHLDLSHSQQPDGRYHALSSVGSSGAAIACVNAIDPRPADECAIRRLTSEADWLKDVFKREGALVLRGLGLAHSAGFRRVVELLCSSLRDYEGGTSPRTGIGDGIYTSTEHPSERVIAQHNEMSYHRSWPDIIAFFCERPPATGGETPVADSREVLSRLPAELVSRFESLGVAYTRTFPSAPGFAGSWQRTFQSSDASEVSHRLDAQGVEFRWGRGDVLHTREVRHALQRHRITGERVWFNQAHMWHLSNLPGFEDADDFPDADDLPMNATFGDGSPISAADLSLVRAAYKASERRFLWEAGDVLLLDNVLFAHGRRAFTGDRRILVAMGVS